MKNQKKLGLAFGSGGTKAYAHIGVLKWLEKNNVNYHFISGTSGGAQIGAFASLYQNSEKIQKVFSEVGRFGFLKYFRPNFKLDSILDSSRMKKFLESFFKDMKISDLKIPFSAVATDVNTSSEVILNSGSVVEAILASSAVPGIFPGVEKDEKFLFDGGISNPVPADVCFKMGAEVVIGVNVSRPIFWNRAKSKSKKFENLEKNENIKKILEIHKKIEELFISYKNFKIQKLYKRNIFNIVDDIFSLFLSRITDLKTKNLSNFLMISPDVSNFGVFQFGALDELIKKGFDEMENNKDEIFKLLDM